MECTGKGEGSVRRVRQPLVGNSSIKYYNLLMSVAYLCLHIAIFCVIL